MHFKKIGENTFQQAWQSLKFMCSKFRTKLNLPPFQVLFSAGKTPLAYSVGEGRLCPTLKTYCTLNMVHIVFSTIIFLDYIKLN